MSATIVKMLDNSSTTPTCLGFLPQEGENWSNTEHIHMTWCLNFVFVPLFDSRWWNISNIHILCSVILGKQFFSNWPKLQNYSRFFLLGLFPLLISTRWFLLTSHQFKKPMTVFAFKFGPKRFFTSFLFCFWCTDFLSKINGYSELLQCLWAGEYTRE